MENPELMLAPDPSSEDETPGAGAVRDLNPHLRPRSRSDYACPHGLCGGEGFVLDEETNVAKACPCPAPQPGPVPRAAHRPRALAAASQRDPGALPRHRLRPQPCARDPRHARPR